MLEMQTDLNRTIELVKNMEDLEKSEIARVLPTEFLIDALKERCARMESIISEVDKVLKGQTTT